MVRRARLPGWALTDELEIIRAPVTDDNTKLAPTPDWDNPTVVRTVRGSLQPAASQVAVQYGLAGVTVTHTAYLEECDLVAGQDRVRLGSTQYVVRDAQRYPGHTEAQLEQRRA